MIFSIPIIAIIADHFQKRAKIKRGMIKDEIELEKLKQQNYLIETEKLRLELEKMNHSIQLEDKTNHFIQLEDKIIHKDEEKL